MRIFCFFVFVFHSYSFFHVGTSFYPYNRIGYFNDKELYELGFTGTDEEVKHFKSQYTSVSDVLSVNLNFIFLEFDLEHFYTISSTAGEEENKKPLQKLDTLDLEEENKEEEKNDEKTMEEKKTVYLKNQLGVTIKYKNIKNQYYNFTGFLRLGEDRYQFDINHYNLIHLGGIYKFFLPLIEDGNFGLLFQLEGGANLVFEDTSEQLKQKESKFFDLTPKLGYLAGVHFGIYIGVALTITVGVELLPLHFVARNENFLTLLFPFSCNARIF